MRRFHRRDDAVAHADARGRLPVWAVDKPPGNGEQAFHAASHEEFRRRVALIPIPDRHFYELLRPDAPAHLYFDVEYEKGPNPTLGDVSIAVDRAARRALRVLCDVEEADLIELDASDARKYSRHMVYKARDGRMFKNPFHCGAFARRVAWPEAATSAGESAPVVDLGVYTKWRAFRTVTSSKLRAPDRPFVRLRPPDASFFDTLVQRGEPTGLIECLERDGSEPASGRGPKSAAGKRRRDDLPDPAVSLPERFCRSLAAEIEAFWGDGPVTFVRYDREDQSALFSSESRWCGQKGGDHSRNHVYFIADLRRGAWRQGCHNRALASCCPIDPATGEREPRWGPWRFFGRADDVRAFVSRSTALQDEYLGLIAQIERRLGGGEK